MATPTQTKKRGRLSLVLGTIIAAVAFTAVAYADNVNNDVVAGGTDTITAGGSTTIGYKIVGTGGDDQPGCNAADGSDATVTINVPAGVSASSSDATWNTAAKSLTFSLCNDFKYVSFSSSSVGNHSITVSISDSGAGTYKNNADFTLTVNAASSDSTAPVITLSTDDAKNATSGWFNSASDSGSDGINLTASASDSSGIKSLSCDDSYKANAAATPAVSSLINESYSSPFSSPQSKSAALSDGIHSITCSATDGVNNAGAATGSTSMPAEYKVDLTAPGVACPSPEPVYSGASLPQNLSATVTDATSGPKTNPVSGSANDQNGGTVALTGEDNAGNQTQANCAYHVVRGSFLAPIDNPPVLNVAKWGRVVPVKFNLIYDGSPVSDPASSVLISVQKLSSCSLGAGTDAIEEYMAAGSANSGNAFRYSSDGFWIYNLDTSKLTNNNCYRLSVIHLDASAGNYLLKLTK